MSELGRLLNEARTAQNLSLTDVEDATRIRQKYLEALEIGDYAALPRGATTRGFLRNYARFLGVDTEEAVQLYVSESGDAAPQILLDRDGQRPLDYRPLEVELINEAASNGWVRWAAAVAIIAVLGAAGWGFLSGRIGAGLFSGDPNWLAALGPARSTPTSSVKAKAPTATRWIVRVTATPPQAPISDPAQALPTSDLLPFPTPTVQPTVTPTPKPTATPEVVARIALKLGIVQRSWVLIRVDGQVAEQGLLEPGQERSWEANDAITVRTGNGAGVTLNLNNEDLGAMGDTGQVVERTWVVNQGQVTEMTPGPGTPGAPGTEQGTPGPAASGPTSTPTPAG